MGRRFGNFSHRIGQEMISAYEYGDQYGYGSAELDFCSGTWECLGALGGDIKAEVKSWWVGDCDDALYRGWGGFIRDDTQLAADTLNKLLEGLRTYTEQICQKRCQLSWWINARAYAEDNEHSPERGGLTHNCANEPVCQTLTDDYKGAAKRTEAEQSVQALLNKGSPPVYYTAHEMRDWDNCSFIKMVDQIVEEFDSLRVEFNRISDEIKYEMNQRGNLTQLRAEKGIEDWHLEIIYVDRDERMVATNPESETAQDYVAEQESRPYVWLGVLTAVSLGAIMVAGKWKAGRGG